MGTARALCFGGETLGFFGVEGLADSFVNGQFELTRLLEMSADHLARVSQHLEEKPHLFVDRLGRCLLAEPGLLVTENRDFGDVGDDLRAEKTADVSKRVFGEGRRTVAEPVASEVLVDDLLKNADSVLPNLFVVVVAIFERSPVLPFGLFRDCSRCRFCRLVDAFSGEAKPVPPIFPSLISCHSVTPVLSVSAPMRRATEGSGEGKTRSNFRSLAPRESVVQDMRLEVWSRSIEGSHN